LKELKKSSPRKFLKAKRKRNDDNKSPSNRSPKRGNFSMTELNQRLAKIKTTDGKKKKSLRKSKKSLRKSKKSSRKSRKSLRKSRK
jgi:hypothetical protein